MKATKRAHKSHKKILGRAKALRTRLMRSLSHGIKNIAELEAAIGKEEVSQSTKNLLREYKRERAALIRAQRAIKP